MEMEKKWYLIMVVVPGDIRRRKVPSIKIFWSSWCLFVQQIPVFRSLGVKKIVLFKIYLFVRTKLFPLQYAFCWQIITV